MGYVLVSQLKQDSCGRPGVHENYSSSGCSRSGNFIDQSVPSITTRLDGSVEIGHAVADVVDSRTPSREKFTDRAIRVGRTQQLNR